MSCQQHKPSFENSLKLTLQDNSMHKQLIKSPSNLARYKELGWEGCWFMATWVAISFGILIRLLGGAPVIETGIAFNAIGFGTFIGILYFGEYGQGRVWYGGVIPAMVAMWGIHTAVTV